MPKFNVGKSGKLLVIYIVKVVFATVICYGAAAALLALIVWKTDMALDNIPYLAIVMDILCPFIIAKISISGIKNSRTVMAVLSVMPALIISVVNGCINPVGTMLFIIRLLLIPSCAVIASFGKKKIKV